MPSLNTVTEWLWGFAAQRRNRLDERRSVDDLDRVRLTPANLENLMLEIRSPYTHYIGRTSTGAMAASIETSAILLWLCRQIDATRVIDLGSGFSSWVLRHYASTSARQVEVVSVDDTPYWMDRTREFLISRDADDTGIIEYDDLDEPAGSFDVVFHDLAGGRARERTMKSAFDLARPGKFVLLDDAHHARHRHHMRRNARRTGSDLWSLRRWTYDGYGRFAMLARKPQVERTSVEGRDAAR